MSTPVDAQINATIVLLRISKREFYDYYVALKNLFKIHQAVEGGGGSLESAFNYEMNHIVINL